MCKVHFLLSDIIQIFYSPRNGSKKRQTEYNETYTQITVKTL